MEGNLLPDLETEEITVRDLIDECLGIESIPAERFDVAPYADVQDEEATLNGDRRLLRAVPDNLIDDAVKNIAPGGSIVASNAKTRGM